MNATALVIPASRDNACLRIRVRVSTSAYLKVAELQVVLKKFQLVADSYRKLQIVHLSAFLRYCASESVMRDISVNC